MFLINKKDRTATSIEKMTFSQLNLSERYDLQEWIVGNPSILGENLLIIQKEFNGFSDTNERLDLLALDERGNLVIIENKLDDSGRDVVWQALKYASYCATLTKTEVCEIYQRFLGAVGDAERQIAEFFDTADYQSIRINPTDGGQRIILVAANYRKEVTSTVLWLRDYGIDITCLKVTPYKDGDKLYLDVEQILPIQDIEDYQIRLTAKKQEVAATQKEEAIRHRLRYRFWEKALPALRTKTGIFSNVSPANTIWIGGAGGYGGLTYNAVILMDAARAELYIDTGDKKRNEKIFSELLKNQSEIESSIGAVIDWQELSDKRACRVCIHYVTSGLSDEEHWEEVIDFLAESLAALRKVLKGHIDQIMKAERTGQ